MGDKMKNKILTVFLLWYVSTGVAIAAGKVSGTIGVSLTILPSAMKNECFDNFCSFNSDSLVKEMKDKTKISRKNYTIVKNDGIITVSY